MTSATVTSAARTMTVARRKDVAELCRVPPLIPGGTDVNGRPYGQDSGIGHTPHAEPDPAARRRVGDADPTYGNVTVMPTPVEPTVTGWTTGAGTVVPTAVFTTPLAALVAPPAIPVATPTTVWAAPPAVATTDAGATDTAGSPGPGVPLGEVTPVGTVGDGRPVGTTDG
jgi:hypothetical protein